MKLIGQSILVTGATGAIGQAMIGRIGKPEVVALVAFLASDEAAFMCGSLVEITGAQAVA